MTTRSRSLAYFVTEDWYFCSHRLQLAAAAKKAGFSVHVITRVRSHAREIEAAGLNLIPFELSRRGKNPFVEAAFILRLARLYREIRPDIVHHVALKPVIYGSLAARLTGVPAVVNALAGLGFLFSSQTVIARVSRAAVKAVFRFVLNNDRTVVILQNPDDVKMLTAEKVVDRSRVRLILGSGVNTEIYRYRPETQEVPIVLLASRMLWSKGVGEFVEAAKVLRQKGVAGRFVLAGEGDDENPGSIPDDQLRSWQEDGDIEWWGRCVDMPDVFAKVHIVCLPTAYGEGVPKVLIEAASCGRPIVATDAPGCREIVIDGENGRLVPVRDVESLVAAIRELLASAELRSRMGMAGRELVKKRFSLEQVINETLVEYGSSGG